MIPDGTALSGTTGPEAAASSGTDRIPVGEPRTLVLLPGLHGTASLWHPLLQHLPPGLQVLEISYSPDEPLGYAELLALVERQLPTHTSYAILAESFSGPLAIQIAAKQPPQLSAIILSTSFARHPLGWVGRGLRYLIGGWMFRIPVPLGLLRQQLLASEAPRNQVAEVRQAIRAVRPAVLARRAREALGCDVREEISRITIPVLILTGNRDRLVSSRIVKDFQTRTGHSVHRPLEAPHLLLQCQAPQAAREIAAFLSGQGS
jgi:pimeloyl-[acyl-carrier protein] methyl ester esterase